MKFAAALCGAAVLLMSLGARAKGGPARDKHYVTGHTTKKGVYVRPHYQKNPGAGSGKRRK